MSDRSTAPADEARVVVGVDGSEPSLRALDMAAEEADRRGAALEMLYSASWPRRSRVPVTESDLDRIRVAAAVVLDDAGQRAQQRVPGLRTIPRIHTESLPADALVASSRTAALTVVGTRGHGGFSGLLVGSVSLRVAVHAQGPLLVVGDSREKETAERGSVLVGLNSEADEPAVRFGFEEAARRGASLRVLHAWSLPRMPGRLQLPPREAEQAREAASELVRGAVHRLSGEHPGVSVSADEKGGSPPATLIEASRTADVMIVAVHRSTRRRLGLQLGPVAHAVLHHAHCPVVTVPTPTG
ncbi:universal stress protein [Streptomyces daqingensis]|jgi:nucleotide-binding universal stress UspA family protein|uniref:Universal stress protein n=1 Tax=Streptomyces daqingensis TaxID=1472640 RepID=A0ABQ2LUK8_9ACTN|nr:universal stress protein [Streptomyces daqingensis]GGO43411.1 universal stress protein [Streptomyces daqingensis]